MANQSRNSALTIVSDKVYWEKLNQNVVLGTKRNDKVFTFPKILNFSRFLNYWRSIEAFSELRQSPKTQVNGQPESLFRVTHG